MVLLGQTWDCESGERDKRTVTDRLWTDERIHELRYSNQYTDSYIMEMMIDEYERALTNHKALIAKLSNQVEQQSERIAELESVGDE